MPWFKRRTLSAVNRHIRQNQRYHLILIPLFNKPTSENCTKVLEEPNF